MECLIMPLDGRMVVFPGGSVAVVGAVYHEV